MGFIKNNKAATLGSMAQKAADSGDAFFTPRLNMPSTQPGLSANIEDWSMMMAAIEASGWQLVHWAACIDTKGRAEAYPVFRRR